MHTYITMHFGYHSREANVSRKMEEEVNCSENISYGNLITLANIHQESREEIPHKDDDYEQIPNIH